MVNESSSIRLVAYLIVVCFFIGCTSTSRISGTYSGNNTYITLVLNADSTFSYRYKFEFLREYSEGKWGVLRNSIIVMNSSIKDRSISIKAEEGYDNSLVEGKLLTINTGIPESENKLYGCSLFINDTLYVKSRCDSISVLKVPDWTMSLFFRIKADERIPGRFLDSLETKKYSLKDVRSNLIKLSFGSSDSLFNYRILDGVRVRISKEGLRMPSFYEGGFLFLPRRD